MSRGEDVERTTDQAGIDRRTFLAVGGAVTTTLIAGCSGGGGGSADGDTSTDGSGSADGDSDTTGTFQLYISDQPVAIGEFDSLDVTVDAARLFRAEESPDDTDQTETVTNSTDAGTTATTANPITTVDESTTETAETTTAETTDAPETNATASTTPESEQAGFVDIEIDDQTVDLTTLPDEKATNVFEGEIPAGSYASVHLSVSAVDGVVDGDSVPVKLPSERLKIVKPFDVAAGEPLEFVFDITVVKKGKSGGYNLLPVIGESGVVGKDVEMEEVAQGKPADTGATEATTEQS